MRHPPGHPKLVALLAAPLCIRFGRPPWLVALTLGSALALAVATANAGGIQSLYSRDGIDVWAVGDAGVVYRSFDGGASWTSGALGDKTLRGVAARGFNVLVVGDSGKVWHSQDSGGTWALSVLPGVPDLSAIDMPSDSIGYVVGSGGTVMKTIDGGDSWGGEVSGTVAHLNALRFSDDLDGWAVGDGGTVLHTTDGGLHWNAIATGAVPALLAVDVRGSHIWVAGAGGVALRSEDGGTSWIPLDLKLDAHSIVKTVWLQSTDSVYIAGGGGFIRRSYDRGATWEFLQHPMQAQVSDVFFVGAHGWATSNRNRTVMSTPDRGTTWSLPVGTTVTRSWDQRLPSGASVRGATIGLSSIYGNTIYCAMGATVYRSFDEGETWSSIATIPGITIFNAFLVSPADSNVMVAAVVGSNDHLVKTTNGGQSWTTTLTHNFGDFGIPLEMDSDRPDTIYFGGDSDFLFRSTDQGGTWSVISNFKFRSPCDIAVVPDSDNIIVIGDGITGSGQAKYYKSIDRGQTFTLTSTQPTGTSEIPGVATCRLLNSVIFGTNWGSGGVQRSPDYGSTWPSVSTIPYAWGVDVCKDDPHVVVFGVFAGGAGTFLSLDGGNTFSNVPLAGLNYTFYARDREVLLAQQDSGIWKMRIQYNDVPNNTQSLALAAPNGGEVWASGTMQNITWTSQNVAVARIEYRPRPTDAWQTLADVPGYQNIYGWIVPADATTEAKVRVRDAWDADPADSSDASFTITVPTAVGERTPTSLGLWQNRPNPFYRSTEIRYSLPSRSTVSLDVFNLQGQRVARLLRGEQGPGEYAIPFGDGSVTEDGARIGGLPAGVYFYRFQAGAYTRTRKMLLLK